MKTLLNFFFFSTLFSVSAQTIEGVVYDSVSAIENIKIENLANKMVTASDENGDFSIKGQVNDTLKISSIFYFEQKVVIKDIHLSESLVIELKKVTNNLDEVELVSAYKEELADIKVVEASLKNQISEDIKNNPHLYRPGGLNPNMDFVQIFRMITKLFKKKDRYVKKPFVPIIYSDIENLFATSSLFSEYFLEQTLKIEKEYKHLFYEYVEVQNLNNTLLEDTQQVQLIETLINLSKDFNKAIEDFKKEQKNKN